MTDPQVRQSTGKVVILVLLVAIVTSVAITLIQNLLLGHSNAAVTGGVVGAVSAVVAIGALRRKSG